MLTKLAAKFLSTMNVEQRKNTVFVLNVDGEFIKTCVAKLWKSRPLNRNLFSYVGKTYFAFNAFFVPDLIYILEEIIVDPETTWRNATIFYALKQLLIHNTWYKRTLGKYPSILDTSVPKKFKLSPYPKQREFLEQFNLILPKYGLRGYLLAGGVGTGKTFLGLMTAEALGPDLAEYIIVICPKRIIKTVWQNSINTLYKKPPPVWCVGDTPTPTDGYRYYVFNQDQIEVAYAFAKVLMSKKKKFFVIVDESHNFNEMTSSRTHVAIELCSLCSESYFMWLSGSPVKAMGKEMIPFLKASDPHFDKDAEQRFSRIYTASANRANEIFNHRFGEFMAFKIVRKDAFAGEPILQQLPVKLTDKQAEPFLITTVKKDMAAYMTQRFAFYAQQYGNYQQIVRDGFRDYAATLTDEAAKKSFALYQVRFDMVIYDDPDLTPYIRHWVNTYEQNKIIPGLLPESRAPFRSALSVLKDVRKKVMGEALGNVLMKRRMECACILGIACKPETIINDAKAKTLIYASYVQPLELLNTYLTKLGFKPIMATGKTETEFNLKFSQFSTNPELNPILATFDFLREGQPITAANTIILINRPYRQYVWEQVIGRALRLGQKNQVYIVEVTLDTGDKLNVSQRTDIILTSIRDDIKVLLGEDFSGPTSGKVVMLAEIEQKTTIESDQTYQIPDSILTEQPNVK